MIFYTFNFKLRTFRLKRRTSVDRVKTHVSVFHFPMSTKKHQKRTRLTSSYYTCSSYEGKWKRERCVRDTGLLQFLWRHRDRRFRKDVTFGKEVHRGVEVHSSQRKWRRHTLASGIRNCFFFVFVVNIEIFLLSTTNESTISLRLDRADQINNSKINYSAKLRKTQRGLSPFTTIYIIYIYIEVCVCVCVGYFLAMKPSPLQCRA